MLSVQDIGLLLTPPPDDTFASQPGDSALRDCVNGCTGSQTAEVIVGMEPGLS